MTRDAVESLRNSSGTMELAREVTVRVVGVSGRGYDVVATGEGMAVRVATGQPTVTYRRAGLTAAERLTPGGVPTLRIQVEDADDLDLTSYGTVAMPRRPDFPADRVNYPDPVALPPARVVRRSRWRRKR